MAESNSSGSLAVRHDQDAFGVKQTSWSAGKPSPSTAAGWHHNTKNTDPDTGYVYMYQRWYNPETGTFLSKAPYPAEIEHQYGFTANNPIRRVDPRGELYDPRLRPGELGEFHNFDYSSCSCYTGEARCVCNYCACVKTARHLFIVGAAACKSGCSRLGPIGGPACALYCDLVAADSFAVYAANCTGAWLGCENGLKEEE